MSRTISRGKVATILSLAFFLFFVLTLLSFAQTFPTKPINAIVTHGPGGAVDLSFRLIADPASKILRQPVITNNNAGAGGSLPLGLLAKEKPDGYHVACVSTYVMTFNPHVRTVRYILEDFAPILTFALAQNMIMVRGDSPWKTLPQLVDYAKKNPGKITYSVSGVGNPFWMTMEYIAKTEGIQWTAMPYPQGDPHIPILAGNVQVVISGPVGLPNVKAGVLRALAVLGEKRWKALPDVPTLRELKYNFAWSPVIGMVAPKGTPPEIIKTLHDAFKKGMDNPEFHAYLEKVGMEVDYRDPKEMDKHLKEWYDRFGQVAKDLKMEKAAE